MLFRLKQLKSRAATAENRQALPGQGGKAGSGLKGSPAIKNFRAGTTEVLLDTKGPGMIRHFWMTSHARKPHHLRNLILRMYWEDSPVPSVEVPFGDFFGVAHGAAVPMHSQFVSMQEGRGGNCYIPMPFAISAKVTVSNETGEDIDWFFYQIDFTLGDTVTEEDGRFHAAFYRENPCSLGRDYTILDIGEARGVYLGCVLGIRALSPGWWGEGEVKMYIDEDDRYPTICGTGMEDYIGSAWGLGEHCTLYQGAPLHRGNFSSLYRFHGPDPVYFQNRIRVTVQQMGCGIKSELLQQYGDQLIFQPKNHPRRHQEDGFYLRSDDFSSVAFWYQYPLCSSRANPISQAERSGDLYVQELEHRIAYIDQEGARL